MKTLATAIVAVFLPVGVLAQSGGVEVGVGLMNPGAFAVDASYFHPIAVKQLYLDAGFKHFHHSNFVTDDIHEQYFSNINQIFVGAVLGDYVFISPKVSWNWYGKYVSFGWGVTAGLLFPVAGAHRFGFSVGYDNIRLDSSLDRFGVTRPITVEVIIAIRLP